MPSRLQHVLILLNTLTEGCWQGNEMHVHSCRSKLTGIQRCLSFSHPIGSIKLDRTLLLRFLFRVLGVVSWVVRCFSRMSFERVSCASWHALQEQSERNWKSCDPPNYRWHIIYMYMRVQHPINLLELRQKYCETRIINRGGSFHKSQSSSAECLLSESIIFMPTISYDHIKLLRWEKHRSNSKGVLCDYVTPQALVIAQKDSLFLYRRRLLQRETPVK